MGGPWRVRLSDLDSGNIIFEDERQSGWVSSTKRYYIRFRIEAWRGSELILTHDLSLADREVLVSFPVGTLGDTIAWFSYVPKFQRAHRCRLTCVIEPQFIPLFRDTYPEILFATPKEVQPDRYYATYHLGLFFDDEQYAWQPCDFRLVGLHRTAGYILGTDLAEEPPRVSFPDDGPLIHEPYICFATQATSQAKHWNSPSGWIETIRFLKDSGYRVICIDRAPLGGKGFMWNYIPREAEDETGDRPLSERARWLKHATAFVGLASGLSWLAWAVGTPVVMISGFSHPTTEFETPYRVINYHACNSCWNDAHFRFDHNDHLWCPRHAGTGRQFECTTLITSVPVRDALMRIPGFLGGLGSTSGS
jgi:autotransporter strand-loop-strand O-heptosyltransferase